ncbi:hypothetical protein AGMMS49960_02390 [Betaproteobacteria bacterium]|nr:hypothetical protein AGMMS49543_21870 [Betaproteobacteria bacterium]GHT98730.1 hypothetical protein AGMMS49960_02390 [Betaproteobacteria bacterium]GHU18593.1 hypothetical protein AGMMS50243_08890 [Betaproteobacteria bacterium]
MVSKSTGYLWLAKISEFIFGGTRGFNEAENRLLSFLMDSLPAQEREILSRQLLSVRLVQRQNPGKIVVAYYKSGSEVPQLPYPGDEYCLANVTYKSGGRTKTTSLVLHNGRFMTFERNVPQSLSEIEALSSVVLHPKGFKSVAQEIDAQEHGEPSE